MTDPTNKRSHQQTSPELVIKETKRPKANMATTEALLMAMEGRIMDYIKASEERINGNVATQVKCLEDTIIVRIKELEATLENLQEENQKVLSRCVELESKFRRTDRMTRKNNIVITGLSAGTPTEAASQIKEILPEIQGEKPVIKNLRVKHTKNGNKVVGTCENFEQKIEIMRVKKDIKTKTGQKIFIDDDLSKEDGELQFLVRQKAKSLTAEGKKVKIGNRKINVNGKWWYINETTKEFTETNF